MFVGADKITGEIVALKRINTEEEENGFPITAIREVKILKALNHTNVVQLKEIVTSKGALVFVAAALIDLTCSCMSTRRIISFVHIHHFCFNWICTVQTAHIIYLRVDFVRNHCLFGSWRI